MRCYLHIPFCLKKCPYCAFYSVAYKEELLNPFLNALKKEIELKKALISEVKSIYFGGGTPSLLGPKAIEELLSFFATKGEITLETNPEDVNEKFFDFYKIGVNRLSLGVQSFDEKLLQLLGRTHGVKKSLDALELFTRIGFTNVSIDLMYDIPTQTLSSWKKSLKISKNLSITHLSLYNLTFEEHTPFYHKKEHYLPLLPKEKTSLGFIEEAELLPFKRYEISAFGRESFHNVGYWLGEPYMGFGPSAYSFIEGRRYKNTSNLKSYISSLQEGKLPIDFEETLPYPQNVKERLAIRLRYFKPIKLGEFQKKHGLLPEEAFHTLKTLKEQELLIWEDDLLFLSKKGKLFYDSVAEALI